MYYTLFFFLVFNLTSALPRLQRFFRGLCFGPTTCVRSRQREAKKSRGDTRTSSLNPPFPHQMPALSSANNARRATLPPKTRRKLQLLVSGPNAQIAAAAASATGTASLFCLACALLSWPTAEATATSNDLAFFTGSTAVLR